MNTKLLSVENVVKVFKVGGGLGLLGRKYVKAVNDVTFSIPNEPTIISLVGESGSGKSTLAKMILGLIRPTSGSIKFMGKDIYSMNKEEWKNFRRDVQAVFQDPYEVYNPFYRVDRVLRVAIRKFGIGKGSHDEEELIEEALKAVGLRPKDIIGRYPHQLSGGERQRIMLARIYLIKPKLIVADEPVSMIDASLRASILDLLQSFKEKLGTSCLFITHDLLMSYYMGGDVFVMCKGKIIEKGNAEDIMRKPLHPYTQLLVSSIPIPDPRRRWKEKLSLKVETLEERVFQENSCVFYNRCPYALEKCKKSMPPFINMGEGREVACFLYQ